MKNILRTAAVAVLAVVCCAAQNTTTVTATNITDAAGNKLAAGQICFLGTDQNNIPINYGIGGGGQVLKRSVCAAITTGAIAGGFTVPNPANTSPKGVLYRVTATDSSTGQIVLQYTGVAFTGSTFDLDNYQPSGVLVPAPPVPASVTGPVNVTGDIAATGSVSAGAASIGSLVSTSPAMTPTGIETTLYATLFTGSDIGAKVNAALAACPSTGCVVVIPSGSYSYSTTIVVTGLRGVVLRGMGASLTGLTYTGTGNGITLGDGTSSATNQNLFVTVQDLSLTGPGTGTGDGIQCLNSEAIVIRNVFEQGFGGDGLNLQFCQYGSVYDSNFGGNGGYGLNVPQATIPGWTRGGNEQANTWVFTNARFFSNAQFGARIQGGLELVFNKATFQSNAAGGLAITADVAGAVGGVPTGTPSGFVPVSINNINPHYESNTGYDFYCQYCQYETEDTPTFASSGAASGHYVVASQSVNEYLTLIHPHFFDAVNPQITVGSAAGAATIDLGDSTAANVSIADTSALVRSGNVFSSPIYGVHGQPFSVGTTDGGEGLNLLGASVTAQISSGGAFGISFGGQTGGTSNAFDFVPPSGGCGSSPCFLTLPSANATFAATNLSQTWTAPQTFAAISATTVANGCSGVSAAMTAGTITISAACITGSRPISLTVATKGGTQGFLSYTQSSGSLVITSSSNTDTSTVAWVQN